MALPPELDPFTVTRGDFLYKTPTNAEWTRLPAPVESWKHNCSGITFDSGVILTQKHSEHKSVCQVKLTLSPPALTTEDGQTALVAACLDIGPPTFTAFNGTKDEDAAVAHAKTLPLASLDRPITAIKLRHLSQSARRGTNVPADNELNERIWALIDRGYRAHTAANKATKLWTVVPHPLSDGGGGGGGGRSGGGRSGGGRSGGSRGGGGGGGRNGSSRSGSGWVDPAETLTRLRERLQTHRVATEQGEMKLRQRLEDERVAMLKTVTAAIDGEWEQKVAAAVEEFREQATASMERIVAKGKM